MAIRPTKGSGIGQVSPNPILPQNPSFDEQLSRIIEGQKPLPMNQGLGINLNPIPGAVGISQVPPTGLPDISPSSITTDEPSIFDSIITPRGQESFGEAVDILGSLFRVDPSGPAAKRQDQAESRRRARNRDQILADAAEVEAQADRDFANSILADAQRAGGQRTEEVLAAAAAQAAGEAGGASGVEGDPRNEGPAAGGKPVADGESDPVKAATMTALDEYLKSARPGVSPEGYDQYIEEFQKATGLDVSGQPDKSTALMAFGLALMQNKAGKGFDVGEMLSAVGGAGEKALPELTAARKEARAIRAKAGEYALGRKKEDEAAARNRTAVYVVPRKGAGSTEKEQLRNRLMQGRYIQVNSYELDALANAEGFDENFEIMPGDVLGKMGDLFKAPESKYIDKPETLTLFEDKNGKVEVRVRLPKAGNENLSSRLASSDQGPRALAALDGKRAMLDQTEARFNEFAQAFSETPPSAVPQAITSVVQLTRSLGFLPITNFQSAVEGENNVQKQKRFLEWVSTSYAPEILQESGKTISDADRQRVAALVGEIKLLQDPIQVAARVNQLHKLIIQSSRAKLAEAYTTLNSFGEGAAAPSLTEAQREELQALRNEADSLLNQGRQDNE